MSAYDDVFIEALQWMWGDGYLAPGGAEEVAELLAGVSIAGDSVLDIGSGLGEIDVLLAALHGAASVVGIDVEPHLIEHARARAARAGFEGQVTFRLVEPGPLPFSSTSFDTVFTKDAIVHIPDKQVFYAEVARVLRPGGRLVGSDWLRGGPETYDDAAREWLDVVHLNFELFTLAQCHEALERGGFINVSLRDRNDWYRKEVKVELASLTGDRFRGLVARIGEEAAAYRLESSRLKQRAIESGFLRPTHFIATKPG